MAQRWLIYKQAPAYYHIGLMLCPYLNQVTVGVEMENYSVNEADGSIQVCAAVQSGVVGAHSFQVGYLTQSGLSAPFAGITCAPCAW